jgi:HSP20 family protein
VRSYPQISLWQDENNYYLESELPGCALEDLDLSICGSQLTLKGERKTPQLENGQWLRQERGAFKFNRTVELPDEVDAENVSAALSNGVLTITLGKHAEVKPRRIEIQTN